MGNENTRVGVQEAPEIQKVMLFLDKEISRLDENVAGLTQKIDPVLKSEKPSEVSEDRCKRETSLAEDIQKDIDAISRINHLIDELRERIAL